MTGIDLIAKERRRQIEVEGWSQDRDCQEHRFGELAAAAACYAMPPKWRGYRTVSETIERVGNMIVGRVPRQWPWCLQWWKPTPDDRIRELVKAGALIAAEIDRLRAEASHE